MALLFLCQFENRVLLKPVLGGLGSENRVLLKPVLGGVGSVAHMNRLSKPSLLFSFL